MFAMDFFEREGLVINVPVAIVYENPFEDAHIEDTLRYGIALSIIDEQGKWAHIAYVDGHGWVLKEDLLEKSVQYREDLFVDFRGAYLFKEADTEKGPFLHLPFETSLEIIEEPLKQHQRWIFVRTCNGQTGYVQRSQVTSARRNLSMDEMVEFSQNFLGLKYFWGGTTSFGYDCSGFVQMLYRQMKINLPRNSWQQAADERFFPVEEAQKGDLVFFYNRLGRVSHVGMMIDAHRFIHACTQKEAWISISFLDDERFSNGYFCHGFMVKRYSGLK